MRSWVIPLHQVTILTILFSCSLIKLYWLKPLAWNLGCFYFTQWVGLRVVTVELLTYNWHCRTSVTCDHLSIRLHKPMVFNTLFFSTIPSPVVLPLLCHFCLPTSFVILPCVSIYRKHGTLSVTLIQLLLLSCSPLFFFL